MEGICASMWCDVCRGVQRRECVGGEGMCLDIYVKGMEGCVWIHLLREWRDMYDYVCEGNGGMYVDTCVKGMEGCVWMDTCVK